MSAPVDPNAAVLPGGVTAEDPLVVANALLHAIRVMAENASSEGAGGSAAEAKDFAAAAKSFADAFVVLDPSLSSDGVPLQHEREMEQMRLDAEARRDEARARQHASAQKKRGVRSIRRTSDGYEMEG